MKVEVKPEQLRRTKWSAYAVRFAFGGLITAFAGFVGKEYGPVVGGLFLGFPAILPASLTLVKKHDGEDAAGDDALGAVAGSGGLIAFAIVIWALSDRLTALIVLFIAAVVWLILSVALWLFLRRFAHRKQPQQ